MLSPARAQRGISLLESLVAIAILASALLGLLLVQLRTLADAESGLRRAQALRLIEDLGERIASNPDGFGQLAQFRSAWAAPAPTVDQPCDTQWCSSEALARWDLARWRQAVARALPHGDATVFDAPPADADSTAARKLGVMIGWRANERVGVDPPASWPPESDVPSVACPVGLICHLGHVQP